MKIVHIAGGGDKGGARPHIIELCATLSKSHDIRLISLRSGDFADEAVAAGVPTEVIFSRFVPADYVRLVRLVRQIDPEIVHCHGAKANVAGVLVKLLCRKPIVSTIHSDWRLDYLHSFVKRNTIGRLNGAALRLFDYFTTVSDQFKHMMAARGFPPQRTMTIYNGIDFSQQTPAFDREQYLRGIGLDYQAGDVVLGIPARLEPVKDIPTLLNAFALARKENPRLKLVVGGDGAEAPRLRQMAQELGLGQNVCFPGWVQDVPKLFKACDIDVLCSISESFPYSILEGIREGCAIITSDVGGMRRLVDHGVNGYIFPPGDVQAFAGYILDLSLNEKKRQQFSNALYQKASKVYSLDSMAAAQTDIYRRILAYEQRRGKRDGVLICGAYGRGNSGDEAILLAIIQSMRALDPLIPITVMTRQPRQTQIINGVDAVYTFNAPAFLRRMRRSRLFINGGGSLIQDSTSSRSLFFYLFTIWAAKRIGCKVLMYGCGIGHVRRPLNRRLSRWVLDRNADIITLRDAISFTELDQMGIHRPDVRAAADPALSLKPADDAAARQYFIDQGIDPDQQYLCISVRTWKDFNRFDIFAQAADYAYEKYGLTPLFLPIEHPKDVAPSHLVSRHLKSPWHLIQTPEDVNLTISLLKSMRLVCAMRLHALVFSAAAQVPVIASSYDIKVSSFMKYIGSDACTGLDTLTVQWLCDQIDRAMAAPGVDPDVTQRLALLEQENARAAAEMLDLPFEYM